MPENDDDELLLPEDDDSPAIKQLRRALREEKRRNKEKDGRLVDLEAQAKRAGDLEKEASFLRAGVPDDGWGLLFKKGYDGELTVEAIKSEWGKLNPKTGGTSSTETGPDLAGEMNRADTMGSAAPTGFDPSREAAFEAERMAAKSQAELIAVLGKYGKLADPHGE